MRAEYQLFRLNSSRVECLLCGMRARLCACVCVRARAPTIYGDKMAEGADGERVRDA